MTDETEDSGVGEGRLDVTVLFPCLNEAESIEAVIEQAQDALDRAGLTGEILVSDNGSDDGSAGLAFRKGARVISSSPRGYGAAYIAGLMAASGEVIVMADADLTYPLERIGEFVEACSTADMSIGVRSTDSTNMPLANRLIGNPVLSGLARRLFSSTVQDFHCGMRAIRREAVARLDLKTTGMEFASEMVILALAESLTIEEIPIEYRERAGESKLRRWSDGWRHVKFLLAHAPNRVFIQPGAILAAVGLTGTMGFAIGSVAIGRDQWYAYYQVVSLAMWLVGLQMLSLGWLTRALRRVSVRQPARAMRALVAMSMERTLLVGVLLAVVGISMVLASVVPWLFGDRQEVRLGDVLVAGLGVAVGGIQLIAVSWCREMVDVSVGRERVDYAELQRRPESHSVAGPI